MDNRLAQLTDWVKQQLANDTLQVESASADASFRRYFRIRATEQTWIAMDAPPEQENSEPFVRISGYLKEMGLTAPVVTAQSWQQGFFLLTDLGNQVYLNMLDEHMADSLYQDAMSALLRMQQQGRNYQAEIPEYGKARLLDEMGLFRDWFLAKHLAIQLTQQQGAILEQVFTFLAEQALQQPHVFVHRDYHSRNLMYLNDATKNPGILDFQDAVWGPVTYDLVSLLRDCYVAWPQQQVMQWVKWYYQQLQTTDLITGVSHDQFIDWFNLMVYSVT